MSDDVLRQYELGPGSTVDTVPEDDPGLVFAVDVHVPLDVGDRVQGVLELEVDFPDNPRAWIEGIRRWEIEAIWNKELALRGETTRVSVTAFRDLGGFIASSPDRLGRRFEVVGLVTHNVTMAGWVLLVVLVAAFATADTYLNGGRVWKATGRAIGSFLGEGVKAALGPLKPVASSLLLAAALLLGVYLWVR